MRPVGYGIDFGTTNSAVAVAYSNGSTQVLKLGDEGQDGLLPSLVYLHRNMNRLAGGPAVDAYLTTGTERTRCRGCELVDWVSGIGLTDCKQFRPNGFCMDSRLISQVKSALSDTLIEGTHSWAVDFELEDLVAVILKRLKDAADREVGENIDRVVLGRPVRFVGADGEDFERAQKLAEQRLERAAVRAGFVDVALVPESQAAVAVDDISDGFVVCTDFGGGTFDVAVIDLHDNEAEVMALDGVAVGGEEFDAKIFDHVIRPAIGLDSEFVVAPGQTRNLPARLRHRLRSLSGLRALLADGDVSASVSALNGCGNDEVLKLITELVYGGQALSFYRAIEAAKVSLSDTDETSVRFRRPWINLNLPLKRSTFEEMIGADLNLVGTCLKDACTAAGIAPRQIEYVTKTGGSSQIPAFNLLLAETFPSASIVKRDPFTCVVSGLAEYAVAEWADE